MLNARTMLIVAMLVPVCVAVPGCTRSRFISRRDYSEIHDPFMQPAAALAASRDSGDTRNDASGLAQLDDFRSDARRTADIGLSAEAGVSADSAGAMRLSGPKPIRRVADSSVSTPAGGIARAVYPGGDASVEAAFPAETSAAVSAAFMDESRAARPMDSAAFQPPSSAEQEDFAAWVSQQYQKVESAVPLIQRPLPGTTPGGGLAEAAAGSSPDFDDEPEERAEPLFPRTSADFEPNSGWKPSQFTRP